MQEIQAKSARSAHVACADSYQLHSAVRGLAC